MGEGGYGYEWVDRGKLREGVEWKNDGLWIKEQPETRTSDSECELR